MTKFIESLTKSWRRALLLTHEGHWLQSEVAKRVFEEVSGDKAKAYAIFTRIGVETNRKSKLLSMWEARKIVDDRATWLACGWGGVSRLVALPARERKKKVVQLRKEIRKGTKPKAAAAKIISKPKAAPPGLLKAVLDDLAKLVAFNPAVLPFLSDVTKKALKIKGKTKRCKSA